MESFLVLRDWNNEIFIVRLICLNFIFLVNIIKVELIRSL